jgi:hypothetical protein
MKMNRETDEASRRYPLATMIFIEMKHEIELRNAKLVVVMIPYKKHVQGGEDKEKWVLLKHFFDDHDFNTIDLRPAFEDAYDTGTTLFFKIDDHWNEAGHQLAAGKIIDYLEQNAIIPAG